jgi:hypothetical protein
MKQPDWRVGRPLAEVLTDPALARLDDKAFNTAFHVVITSASASPKRRTVQLTLRAPGGGSTTWHAPAADVRTEPA